MDFATIKAWVSDFLQREPHPTQLTVEEADGAPSVKNVRTIKVTNASLTDNGNHSVSIATGGGGGGAPTDADYLVGTANAGLSAEIVVGATPGGELGGTWASPTVDATHSGSAHSAYVANSLYDAQSILAATADDTPAAVTVAEQRLVGRLTGGNIDDITIGIADDNILQVDQASTADDNDYAKFTANGIEGRSYAEVISDLGLKTVATDTIWAAAGDLAVATGNDAAGVLTKGTDGKVLTMVAGAVAWAAAAGGGGVSDAAFSF